MRNNPKHGTKLEYEDMFVEHIKVEQIRRFFLQRRRHIFKHFSRFEYSNNFLRKHVDHYLAQLDTELGLKGKLKDAFNINECLGEHRPDDLIGFDNFYDALSRWGVAQKQFSCEDFSRNLKTV